MTKNSNLTGQQARAMRLMAIRKSLKMSREEFARTFGIAKGTLQHWENPSDASGLTERSASRLQQALSAYGIEISVIWLTHGMGDIPLLPRTLQVTDRVDLTPQIDSREKEHIQDELDLFHSHYRDAVSLMVPDNQMLPVFAKDDIVAGTKLYGNAIGQADGKHCIIMTTTGELRLRTVNKCNVPLHYRLSCLNAGEPQPVVELNFAAPVIFFRRHAVYLN